MIKHKKNRSLNMNSFLAKHGQAFFFSLGKLWRQPLANVMTISVIGIALALPAILFILLQNMQNFTTGWQDQARISLFLKQNVSIAQVEMVRQQLLSNIDIANVNFISPSEGLKQLEQQGGFGNVLQQLQHNPLPSVFIIEPSNTLNTPIQIQALLQQLKQIPEVDIAQLDMGWVNKLFGMINLAKNVVWGLALLLAAAVILIVGNTIRLSIQNHKAEIEVTKLVGATAAFVRRPFLYTGILYGFFGAVIAYILVSIILILLSGPIENLSNLYQSSFALSGFNLFSVEMLFIAAMALGLVGSWVAIARQLKKIEPA